MPNDSHRPDVAVFIDFENVYVSVRDKLDANPNFESIMDRCEDLGRVVIARAYADWYRYPRVTSALYANSIEPMYVPTYYYDREMGRTGRPIKNSVDMNLCVDAMKTLYTNPNIEKFVLATGDRDFIPLVNTIRQQGKDVIVIGIGGAASAHLAQSADEFIFYEALVGKKTGGTIDDVPRAKMPEKGREGYEHSSSSSSSEEAPTPTRRSERESSRPSEREHSAPTPAASVPAPAPTEPAQPDIYDTLVKAIHLARERGYVCSFGSLKLLMKELMGGDFKESRYKDVQGRPFAKFKDFVLEGERRGRVQVFTNGTVNEVFLPGEDPYKLSQFAAELKVDADTDLPTVEATTVPTTDQRGERAGSTGRRRRRRRPSRQSDRNGDGSFEDATEEFEAESLESAELPELPELPSDSRSDEVFEELLERIETEDARLAQVADEQPVAEAAAPADEQPVAEAAAPADDEQPTLPTRPFEEGDWQFLRTVISAYGKPASFAQIHDLLRGARNQQSITRTNEELRSLVKQAINNGLLLRQGKGNRISYRLGEAAPQVAEATPESNALISVIDQATQETPTADQVEPAAELAQPEAAAEVAAPKRSTRRRKAAPKAEPAPEAVAPAPAAPEEPKAAPKRSTRRKAAPKAEPAPEAAAPAPAAPEEPKAAPKRSTRRRKPTATEE